METDWTSRDMDRETQYLARPDAARGLAFLAAGAAMVLLHWVLPPMAPLAVAAYGVYQLFKQRFGEAAVAILIAVALWYTRLLVGWVLWLVGAAFVVAAVFYLIQGLREPK
jgi:hypothetical protein